jgi:hypothetical protein
MHIHINGPARRHKRRRNALVIMLALIIILSWLAEHLVGLGGTRSHRSEVAAGWGRGLADPNFWHVLPQGPGCLGSGKQVSRSRKGWCQMPLTLTSQRKHPLAG